MKLGYIRLKQFNANAAKEMKISLKELEKKNLIGLIGLNQVLYAWVWMLSLIKIKQLFQTELASKFI